MYKMVVLIIVSTLLLIGCSPKETIQTSNLKVSSNKAETVSIMGFSQSIFDANQLFFDKVIDEKSPTTKDSIDSIKTLISLKIKNSDEEYQKLSRAGYDKLDEVVPLKKGLDKLKKMHESLDSYSGSKQERDKMFDDWKTVGNYWTAYTELQKKKNIH